MQPGGAPRFESWPSRSGAPATIFDADLAGPLALVVGAEAKGLRHAVASRADEVVGLPMRGRVGSLNAAVAGSVGLYEVLRQRGNGRGG